MKISTAPRAITLVGGIFFLVTGVWAFAAPRSFFDVVATYPPFNEHLFHDLGAFQIGLAVALLAALFTGDALLVVLIGAGSGSIVHAIAHFMDSDLGGRASDPWSLALFAGLLVVGAALQRNKADRLDDRPERRSRE